MKTDFKKSFLKDLQKLTNPKLKSNILQTILQVEEAGSIGEIRNLKKLSGFDDYYRIRVNDYRIGLKIENETVYFVVFQHRKDIYKTFP